MRQSLISGGLGGASGMGGSGGAGGEPPCDPGTDCDPVSSGRNGSLLFHRPMGGALGFDLAIRGQQLALTGSAYDSVDFGRGPLLEENDSGGDLFVGQMSPWLLP